MKKTIAAACITLVLVSAAALAAGLPMVTDGGGDVREADTEQINAVAAENFDKASADDVFESIVNCNDEAAANNVAAYVRLISNANFTEDEIALINKILAKGTTPQSLSRVYDFWLTTGEPFEIIDQICALEDKYFNEYWYEDAFNELTDNKCGVLDNAAVGEYLARGVTTDDLMAANVLCRKGVYTITEILDKFENGESMDDIIRDVYGIDALPESDGAYDTVQKIFEAKKYSGAETAADVSINAMSDSQTIENAKETFMTAAEQQTKIQLERLNISANNEYDDDMTDMALDNGFTMNIIRTLADKGYTPQEICLASENVGDDFDILAAAKYAREVLNNE